MLLKPGMNNRKYNMSFTVGGLWHRESCQAAKLYLEIGDWKPVREKVLAENIFQARTESTLIRISREVIFRLQTLNEDEVRFLLESNAQQQAYLLWVAVCRRYRFIAEFAVDVLRERHAIMRLDLHYENFDVFYDRKSETNPQLEKITEKTRGKLRQNLFRMMRDAGLLSENNRIETAMLDRYFIQLISNAGNDEDLLFPFSGTVLKRPRQ